MYFILRTFHSSFFFFFFCRSLIVLLLLAFYNCAKFQFAVNFVIFLQLHLLLALPMLMCSYVSVSVVSSKSCQRQMSANVHIYTHIYKHIYLENVAQITFVSKNMFTSAYIIYIYILYYIHLYIYMY